MRELLKMNLLFVSLVIEKSKRILGERNIFKLNLYRKGNFIKTQKLIKEMSTTQNHNQSRLRKIL